MTARWTGVFGVGCLLMLPARAAAPGPAGPVTPATASTRPAAACGRCHAAQHADWSTSGHARAFSSPLFQAGWADHPQAWCAGCHAPTAGALRALGALGVDPSARVAPPADPAAGLPGDGVPCAACHQRGRDPDKPLQIGTPGPPSLWARLAHPAAEDPGLRSGEVCAGCHDFPFPAHRPIAPFTYGDQPLQATFAEWSQSADARAPAPRGCAGCHLPGGRHTFPGAHDPAFVGAALELALTPGCPTWTATLTATGAAHAVPTGDPWRAVELELCADLGCAAVVGRARFGRSHAPDATTWRLTADTRVPPATDGPAAARALAVAVDGPVVGYRLWMRLADPRTADPARARPLDPALARVLLREGPVPAAPPCPGAPP